jgi:hypothetical protein
LGDVCPHRERRGRLQLDWCVNGQQAAGRECMVLLLSVPRRCWCGGQAGLQITSSSSSIVDPLTNLASQVHGLHSGGFPNLLSMCHLLCCRCVPCCLSCPPNRMMMMLRQWVMWTCLRWPRRARPSQSTPSGCSTWRTGCWGRTDTHARHARERTHTGVGGWVGVRGNTVGHCLLAVLLWCRPALCSTK